MEGHLYSSMPYLDVRRSSGVWGDTPSGLGYYDMALYVLLGRKLERDFRPGNATSPYWALDLGTYFGHSAFSVAYGASRVHKHPGLRVLSLDIFQQPQWLLENNPEVMKFTKTYGSTEPDAIAKRLDVAFAQIGMTGNPIQLMKQDVCALSPEDLLSIAPEGYKLIMVDCGKTPELMNRITEFLMDIRICPLGTLMAFQDFFDWHAPWNVFALWQLLRTGVLSMHRFGPRMVPCMEKTSDTHLGIICDRIQESPLDGETWCTAFTSLEKELAALDEFIALFHRWEYTEFAFRLECLKIGAFLRAGLQEKAEAAIRSLDQTWPMQMPDYPLQNAYCRLMHLRTGRKDLSLVLDTPSRRARKAFPKRKMGRIFSRASYLKPVYSQPAPFAIKQVGLSSQEDSVKEIHLAGQISHSGS
jgi:hypothetical protein